LCLVVLAVGIVRPVVAQPRPDDVQSAAAAFGEGQRAQLRGEYARAADLFELADRTAPTAAALRSAIRNHQAAGQIARAATLSLIARTRHADDLETMTLAGEVLAQATPTLARTRIRCVPACALAIDGRSFSDAHAETFDLFIEPGVRRFVSSWPGRDTVERSITAVAGVETEMELVAPAAPVVAETTPGPARDDGGDRRERDAIAIAGAAPATGGGSSGLSPWIFATGAGLTAIALGLGIGFGIDVLSANDAYRAMPTRLGYEDGVGRQWVANGFYFAALGLGIATAVIALFTDWDGEPETAAERAAITPWLAPTGGDGLLLGASGRLGGGS
jgi:hypothetical protein